MKRKLFFSLMVSVMLSLTSCGALVDTTIGSDYYGIGFDNYVYPSVPGAPIVSPGYWGSTYDPIYIPVGGYYPGYVPPKPPPATAQRPPQKPQKPSYNGPTGNHRPPTGSTPTVLPDSKPVPSGSGNTGGSHNGSSGSGRPPQIGATQTPSTSPATPPASSTSSKPASRPGRH